MDGMARLYGIAMHELVRFLRFVDACCRLSSNAEASLGPCPCYLHHFADYELSSRSWY